MELRHALGDGPRETYILEETRRLLGLLGSSEASPPGAVLSLAVRPKQLGAVSIESDGIEAEVAARDLESLLHGVYLLFEHAGASFQFSGERLEVPRAAGASEAVPSAATHPAKPFPVVTIRHTPSIRDRGIRMHLNFVQDQSFASEEEFAGFIDAMARMRMNYLCFHMYNPQEWFTFSYRGVEHLDLALGNLGRRSLPAPMIGRDRVRVKDHWFPRELEGITDIRELRGAVHARYCRMMARARARSIRVAISIEPESLPEAFRRRLPEWSAERTAREARSAASPASTSGPDSPPAPSLVDDWQTGWSGVAIAEADVRDPVVVDIAVERCLQCMAAFPDMDEFHLISREGTAWRKADPADYRAELGRLSAAFAIPDGTLVPDDLAAVPVSLEAAKGMDIRATQYWTIQPGENLYPTVIASLRFLEFCRAIMADPRVAAAARSRGIRFAITVYSPHPATIRLLNRAAPHMLPRGTKLHLLADYGARDIAAAMDGWQPLQDAGLDTGLISWLEFDGSMMLCQGWTSSIADNVRKARAMGIQTVYFNHWRIRGLEHNARVAADAMWDADRGTDEIVGASLASLYGGRAAGEAAAAHALLEAATIFCKQHLFNVGFTADWVFLYSTSPPGYDWADLVQAADGFTRATDAFRRLAEACTGPRRRQAEYLAELCGISVDHLEAVGHLQNAKLPLVGYGAWPLEASADGATLRLASPRCPSPEVLEILCREAEQAAALEQRYMERYAPWVERCDEQGQLVMHHWGAVVPLGAFTAALRTRLESERGRRANRLAVPD